MIRLANLLACGDDPKSLTQLAKNEVYSSGVVSSLVIVLHDKFRHPVSTRQNNWKSTIVIRVAQAFVSSFLFEVLISGILLGLSGTFIFDHSLKSFVSQLGPLHHKGHSANSEDEALLVHKSAGFSTAETCCHCDGSVNIRISPIRLATNGRKSFPRPRIRHRTSVLSEKNVMLCIGDSKTVSKDCVERKPRITPMSSSLGTVIGSNDATLPLAAIRISGNQSIRLRYRYRIRSAYRQLDHKLVERHQQMSQCA